MTGRLTVLVIVGTRTDEHSLRSQVGIGSESDCLFGQLERISWTSDSEAGVNTEKLGEWQEERVSVTSLYILFAILKKRT